MMAQPATRPVKLKHNQFTDLQTILRKYFFHWPLFLIGVTFAVIAAASYLLLTKPAYQISATILVKDEKKAPKEKSGMDELDLSKASKNAETEIQIITSKKLISEVVNNLRLHVSYQKDNVLSDEDIYENKPFTLLTYTLKEFTNPQDILISIHPDQTFSVSDNGSPAQKFAYGKTITSDLGTWALKPTPYLKKYEGTTVKIKIANTKKITDAYAKKLDARLLDKAAPTIGLFLTDETPQRGKDFLNQLIKVYNEDSATEERKITKSTIEFIDQRLASLTGELSNAESKVEGYRSSKGLTDISLQSKTYLENVQSNDTKLNEVNVQLGNINGIERYVNSSAQNMAPATVGLVDEALNGLIKNLTELELKRAELLATTPEANPMFAPINTQIKTTKAAIRQNISGIKRSLLSAKNELQSINQKNESAIKDIPGQERQYVGMKRQESIKENLYVYLLQKREEFAISYASTQADARIVDQANIGDIKWPRPALVVVVALLLGLGIPFMIIYFRYAFNQKVVSRTEIEEVLDLPILGDIALTTIGNNPLVVNQERHIVGEQFRSIRTNLYLQHQKLSKNNNFDKSTLNTPAPTYLGRVTLCTSSTSQEGKSFVSSNLALTIASSGRKTVLLEMDLRRPKIAQVFNLSNGHLGIGEFLMATAALAQIIQPSGIHENLFVISAGQIIQHPSELLEGKKLGELLSALRRDFEDIIIDTPPLHLVTDAMIIGRFADISMYILRQGHTGKEELLFIEELANSEQLPNINLIFNGITSGKYGYGYSYDNSYYLKKEPKNWKSKWELLRNRL